MILFSPFDTLPEGQSKTPIRKGSEFFWWSIFNENRTLNEITCGDEILTPFG